MSEKVDRSAFLYLDPVGEEDDFAQCETCRMFVPEMGRCIVLGSKVSIDEDDSCGFYTPWPDGEPEPEVVANHAKELASGLKGAVSPQDAGLVDREVRCENCKFFDEGPVECGLYKRLNAVLPQIFALNAKVDEYGCCNANTPKEGEPNPPPTSRGFADAVKRIAARFSGE